MTVQFVEAEELFNYLGTDLDPERVPQADLLLQLVSAIVQAETHQQLVLDTADVVKLMGNGASMLLLPELPVNAITSVVVNTIPPLTLASTDYTWTESGALYRNATALTSSINWSNPSLWPSPPTSVTVTYNHGFAVIPDDIRALCLQVAGRGYSNPRGIASESVANEYSVSYGATHGIALVLTDAELAVLQKYRP